MLTKTLTTLALLSTMAGSALAGDMLTRFDVAEDQTRFAFAPAPVFDDGYPAHGNPFVTQGYIYPAGTLADGVSGVLENGDAAFPDKVLGTWTCDGWFVGDATHTKTGTWLLSRQVFEFADGDILITQGPEIADQGKTFVRPITGGTGDYASADGVIEQTLLGFTEHMGVSITFAIPPGGGDA
ncbi:MAG: hypothetical protein GY798_28515 [Hyphomicrobiales bacterium]|nr:hypothetical protein [Hyphomicrobiales bacterium]